MLKGLVPYRSRNTISYDFYGNMTNHVDKGILEIRYNDLDLPKYIKFNNFVTRTNGDVYSNMSYLYRADGVKIKKVHHYFSGRNRADAFATTEYIDGFQYGDDQFVISGPLVLKFFGTSEGYYDYVNNRYIYHYSDHLGNVRVSFAKENNTAVIVQQNDYYAFGLKHNTGIDAGGSYKYKYNGKELQTETGMYAMDFRHYMPDVGRFTGMDALSESYADHTPFHFSLNNSANYSDPTGMYTRSADGNMISTTNQGEINELFNYFSGGGSVSGMNSFMQNNKAFALDVNIDEVVIPWKKGGGSGGGSYNGLVMESKVLGALRNWNTEQNWGKWQTAINETAIGKSIGSLERGLFLELPMSLAGGELVSMGWRAANLSRYICAPLGRLSNNLIKICFTKGTLVATEKGSKKIEDIKEGDLVWSYNEETGKKELKKVVELSRNTSSSLVKISVNGTEITCTPEHPFYVNGNWVEAKNLVKGMLLTTLDGKTSPVESIKFLDEKVKVYNFEVEGNHNYYVSEQGILVHNDCGINAIIEAMPSSLKQLNMCKDFAASLMERMTAQGMKGELLTLKSRTDFIWSNTFNRTITTNGDHVGVKVGNMVYDNLYPKGIEYSKWLMDLEVGSPILGMPKVTPF